MESKKTEKSKLIAYFKNKADDHMMAMIYLHNSKNDAAKKDFRVAHAQGNKSVYDGGIEKMARTLASQYKMKETSNPNYNGTRKSNNTTKKNDKDEEGGLKQNAESIAGAHIEDESDKDKKGRKDSNTIKPDGSVGAHILDSEDMIKVTPQVSVKSLLASYPIDDPIWGGHGDDDNYLVDTKNSEEEMLGFHSKCEDDLNEKYQSNDESLYDEFFDTVEDEEIIDTTPFEKDFCNGKHQN